MVDHSIPNHFQFTTIMEIFVNCVAAGENDAIQQHHIAHLELANVGVNEWRFQTNHFCRRQREIRYRFLELKFMWSLIQPVDNLTISIQHDTPSSISPTHVSNRDKK